MHIENGRFLYSKKDLLELSKRYKSRIKECKIEGFIPRYPEEYHIEDCQNLFHNINKFADLLQLDHDIEPESLTDEEFLLLFEIEFKTLDSYEKKDYLIIIDHFKKKYEKFTEKEKIHYNKIRKIN